MESNKYYKIAKILILITLVIMITIPVCLGLAFLILSLAASGTSNILYQIAASVFYIGFGICGIPCLAMSIIGTICAIKARKDGISKATVFIILGIILIPITAVWSYFAPILTTAWMGV